MRETVAKRNTCTPLKSAIVRMTPPACDRLFYDFWALSHRGAITPKEAHTKPNYISAFNLLRGTACCNDLEGCDANTAAHRLSSRMPGKWTTQCLDSASCDIEQRNGEFQFPHYKHFWHGKIPVTHTAGTKHNMECPPMVLQLAVHTREFDIFIIGVIASRFDRSDGVRKSN